MLAMSYGQRMRTAVAKKVGRPDRTFYPVSDNMGEGLLHREIAEVLRILLQRFLTGQGKVARVGANQFIYWVQGDPTKTVASDVYVLPGVDVETPIECWKVWETGIVPSFAVEVVSKTIKKDYQDVIERYAELGVPELILFDHRAGRASSRRVRWQVFRRIKGRGLVRVEVSNEDRVKSKVLDCWLRAVGKGQQTRVRVATGPAGEDIFASAEEAEARARTKAEAAAAAAQAEAARLRAELEELRQELAAVNGPPRKRS